MKTLMASFAAVLALSAAATERPSGAAAGPPQATMVDEVLVPVPREIFTTLDRFANSNWHAVQRPDIAKWRPLGTQSHLALLLGAVIAEGFIAVEAEDAVQVQSLGRAVLTLARGLGVEKAALRRSRSIVEHAEKGDWGAVRTEWDGVLPDVRQAMADLKSEELAHLVSLGGWARGAEAMGAVVLQDYSPDRAKILQQPAMLTHFERRLAALRADDIPASLRSKSLDAIAKVSAVVQKPELTNDDVKAIAAVSRDFLEQLNAARRSP